MPSRVHFKFTHKMFDELAKPLVEALARLRAERKEQLGVSFVFDGEGEIGYLTTLCGNLRFSAYDTTRTQFHPVWNAISMRVDPFTGNCGARAISYIYTSNPQASNDTLDPLFKSILKYCEGIFALGWNAGLQVGSDNIAGSTINSIKRYGEGYEISEGVRNWNYGPKGHEIVTWYKRHHDLPIALPWANRQELSNVIFGVSE